MTTEKIAFICDDEHTISAHFGRAPLAVVVTLEDGQAIAREVREKAHHGAHDHHAHDHHGGPASRFAAFADCDVMIVGGMGQPAANHAQTSGMRLLVVAETDVEAALTAYREGSLEHDPDRIHQHHAH